MFALVPLFGLLTSAWGFDPQFLQTTLDGRIIGGKPIDIREAPYQISLQTTHHRCGGSIISKKFIVTAAHCVDNKNETYRIRAGSAYQRRGGVIVNVAKVNIHPKYVKPDYDIAVLELENELEFNEAIQPIPLADDNEEVPAGAKSVASGWGNTREGGWQSNQLLAVEVPIVAHKKCQKLYSKLKLSVTENMICTGLDEGGKSPCQNDSGGPLVVNGKLVGVVIWANGCALPRYPNVYTSVPALRQFIRKISGV